MLRVASPIIGERERELVNECIDSGMISWRGKFIKEFEELFAKAVGADYAILVNSGTSALHVAAMSLKPFNKVIVPDYTFIASIVPGLYTNTNIELWDIEDKAWSIDISEVDFSQYENSLFVPVAISGYLWDVEKLSYYAGKYNFKILADMAQALGTTFPDNSVVTQHSDAAIYSMFPNKVITTGEGGVIVTDDPEVARLCRLYRSLPVMDNEEDYANLDYIGYNYRPTNIQAALGIAQLEKLDYVRHMKQQRSFEYRMNLQNEEGLSFQENILEGESIPLDWQFRIKYNDKARGIRTRTKLTQAGIETTGLYTPLSKHPALRKYLKSGLISVSDAIFNREPWPNYEPNSHKMHGFYVPTHQDVTTEDINKIVNIIQETK